MDSKANGLFAGKNLIRTLGLHTTTLKDPISITMANGEKHQITEKAKDVQYAIQGFTDKIDILILPTDHDQVILGNHWLSRINPTIN